MFLMMELMIDEESLTSLSRISFSIEISILSKVTLVVSTNSQWTPSGEVDLTPILSERLVMLTPLPLNGII
jgi:hypothetical protein